MYPLSSRILAACRFLLGLALLAAVAFTPIRAHADIQESSDLIVDTLTRKVLDRLPNLKFAFPAQLASDQDVILLVTQGGAYVDARLLARPSVQPQQLAAKLQRAMRNIAPQPETIEWSREDDYSAAHFAVSRAHWGKDSGRFTFPLGKLVNGLKAENLRVHGILRLPAYVQASDLALPRDVGTNSNYVLIHAAPPDMIVSTSADMAAWETGLAVFLNVGVTVAGLMGLLIAVLFARASSLSNDKRRPLFTRIANWPLWTVLALATTIGFFYMSSTMAARTADLWLGSMQRASTATFLFINIPVFLVLSLVGFVAQAKLFAEPPTPEQQAAALASQDERALRKRIAYYSLIPWVCGMGLLLLRSYVVPHKSPLSQLWYMASMFLCCFGSYGVQWLFRRQLKTLEEEISDADLTHQAELLAHDLNFNVSLVYIGNSEAARNHATIEVSRSGRIVVSRKCRELLDESEMNFALAAGIARSQADRFSILKFILYPSAIVWIIPYIMINHVIANQQLRLGVVFSLLIGMMGGAAILGRGSWKRVEAITTKQALKATWNLDAALSASRKLLEHNSQVSGSSQQRESVIAKQRNTLERTARELGIL